jgi:predicted nucleic acid-binding protein
MALDLPDGSECFIDANIFYYHFVETPRYSDQCTDFLARVSLGRITAFTSVHAIADAVHKIMVTEAAAQFSLNRAGLVTWLQNHPEKVKELRRFRDACEQICGSGLVILTTDSADLMSATVSSQRFGLLTNDATIVALMFRHGLTNLVTNDQGFRSVGEITVWQPR